MICCSRMDAAFVVVPEHRFDAPPKEAGGRRRGLAHDGTGLVFEELERGPLLRFRFENSILGRGKTTRDILLLRASRPGKSDPRGTRNAEDEDSR